MYEVYNDRIFDLLSPANQGPSGAMTRQGVSSQKDRRRPLLFKSTEGSPDRKVVAGLRKVICNTYEEALMILETGLLERRVAGTGSNSVSSRSHGFFCLDVKKKVKGRRIGEETWVGNTLTIVDLAGKFHCFLTIVSKVRQVFRFRARKKCEDCWRDLS
jgi:Kinesin motor domain